MNTARAVGRALSLLDSELPPFAPYCPSLDDRWRFEGFSFLLGLVLGLILLPFLEVLLALRVWALRYLLAPQPVERAPTTKPLYRLH